MARATTLTKLEHNYFHWLGWQVGVFLGIARSAGGHDIRRSMLSAFGQRYDMILSKLLFLSTVSAFVIVSLYNFHPLSSSQIGVNPPLEGTSFIFGYSTYLWFILFVFLGIFEQSNFIGCVVFSTSLPAFFSLLCSHLARPLSINFPALFNRQPLIFAFGYIPARCSMMFQVILNPIIRPLNNFIPMFQVVIMRITLSTKAIATFVTLTNRTTPLTFNLYGLCS